jgi:hypothetical protein
MQKKEKMNYAIIAEGGGGIVNNVTICDDADFAASQGWIKLEEGFWIGDKWDVETGFTKPNLLSV